MNDISNQYSALGFNPGYYDLLILDRVNSTEPLFEYNFGNIFSFWNCYKIKVSSFKRHFLASLAIIFSNFIATLIIYFTK